MVGIPGLGGGVGFTLRGMATAKNYVKSVPVKKAAVKAAKRAAPLKAPAKNAKPADPLKAPLVGSAPVLLDANEPSATSPTGDVADGAGAELSLDMVEHVIVAPGDEPGFEKLSHDDQLVASGVTYPDLGSSLVSQLARLTRSDGKVLEIDMVTTSLSERELLVAEFLAGDVVAT